jgi:alginate O-acetyltransferase complex protein AlgI
MCLAVLGWAGGLCIGNSSSEKSRGWTLTLFISLNLGILCWFKYSNIVMETVNSALGGIGTLSIDWERIILPIGLSFIALQSISYLIDVYRRTVPADRSFIGFATYQSMFVHLIAGPIIRYDWVKSELRSRPFNWTHFCLGARRFMIGMSMKVLIADTLAPVVDLSFSLQYPSFSDAWIGCLAYSLQLFFDFAGYSVMAIGLGMILGFRFPENFNHPYLASSIQDFWRRWHISLSTWLRDYLYIPLGGNRVGEAHTYINLLLTMSIAGLWHGGDSWNFLIWGIAQGLALCLARIWSRNNLPQPYPIISRVLTLLFVFLAWTIFRAHTFDDALRMYSSQLGMHGFNNLHLSDEMMGLLRPTHWLAALLGIACITLPLLIPYVNRHVNPLTIISGAIWPVMGFLLSFALIASRGAVPFLYFQF